MQRNVARERNEQRRPQRFVGRPSRRGSSDLDRLHGRLRASLGEPLSQGSLRLALREARALVFLDGRLAFDDLHALTHTARRAVGAIGRELRRAPQVFALIAGHAAPPRGESDPAATCTPLRARPSRSRSAGPR